MAQTRSNPELDYRPVPDVLRVAFRAAVMEFDGWCRGEPEPWVQVGRGSVPISHLFMAMRFLAEPVPRDLAGVAPGRTYAVACRRMIALMP